MAIDIVKQVSVDGGLTFLDANTPPGPVLVAPTDPVFRYVVTNTGPGVITGVTVVDSDLGIILQGVTLQPGAETESVVTGTFAAGEHCNTATATGQSNGQTLTDSDTACYIGAQAPSIDLVKRVSVDGGITFVDANNPPGPVLVGPTNPFFRFIVTNTGDAPLTLVSINDSALGPVLLGGNLGIGASTVVTVEGTFAVGLHCNTATATGQAGVVLVTDQDSACYTGAADAGITVRKRVSVNGGLTFVDANSPPGPFLVSPTNPLFQFVVTNSGATTLTGVTLTDSSLGPITLPTTTLMAGQSVTVTQFGTFAQGQHCNLATAAGTAGGLAVTDTDSACFRGIISAIPVFPDISGPAPQPEIIDRLLETIALEELALAALINAEAEKVQAVAAAGIAGPVDADELARINLAVAEVIRMAGVKEEHLRRKLIRILAHKERGTTPGTGG